jgi:hypothetical protein
MSRLTCKAPVGPPLRTFVKTATKKDEFEKKVFYPVFEKIRDAMSQIVSEADQTKFILLAGPVAVAPALPSFLPTGPDIKMLKDSKLGYDFRI